MSFTRLYEALAAGKRVFAVSAYDWSFAQHPRCRRFNTLAEAVAAARALLTRCRNSAARASHLRRRLQRVCCRRCGLSATSRRCGGWANIQALFQKKLREAT